MAQNPSSQLSAERKRWSSLPDDIISNILSRLDLPRNFIITISDTTFDIIQSNEVNNIPKIIPILDNIFTIFTTPFLLNSVRLHLQPGSYEHPSLCRAIDSWARRLRCCNVKHFKSTSNCRYFYDGCQVHAPSVFQIQSLVSIDLDLSTGVAWRFPDSINLPNLKKLSSIFVNVKCIEKFISSSPSLEDLSFTLIKKSGCPKPFADGSLTIVGTNLTRLSITLRGFYGFDDFTRLNLHIDAPKLEHFNFTAPLIHMSHNQIIRQLINLISHVKSLVLNIAIYAAMSDHSPNIKTIFPNVTHLTWSLGRFGQLEILPLLLPCPKLEVLVLNFVDFDNVGGIADTKTTLYEHMKRLEFNMTRVRFDDEFLELTKYFLRRASCLEKLVLNASFLYSYDNYQLAEAARFHRDLLDCPRRSSSLCEIEFEGAYRYLIYPTKFDSE